MSQDQVKNEGVFIRGLIVATCEETLAEKSGIIAACRRLSDLGLKLFGEHDDDFSIFEAIESETDHLPLDDERENWGADALKRKDEEIAIAQDFYKDQVLTACRKLIERFKTTQDFTI